MTDPDLPMDKGTAGADSPPGGGRGRSGVVGLVALVAAVGLLLLVVLVLLPNGGVGPQR